MADKENLRDMLDAFIADNDEEAQVNLHTYVTDMMRDKVGTGVVPEVEEETDDE